MDTTNSLAERIQALIDQSPRDSWPQSLQHEHNALLVHGNQAYLWFLTPRGVLYSVDWDRFALPFELEEDPATIQEVLDQAVRRWPELSGLLTNLSPG